MTVICFMEEYGLTQSKMINVGYVKMIKELIDPKKKRKENEAGIRKRN